MKRKISLITGSIIGVTLPVITVISCGNTNSIHTISKETQMKIETALKGIKNPLGNLIVGKGLNPVQDNLIQEKLKAITDSVIFDQIMLYKKDKAGGEQTEALVGEEVLNNYEYTLVYLLQPSNDNQWADGKNTSGVRRFAEIKQDSTVAQPLINANDFKNLTFSNLNDLLSKKMMLSELKISNVGKTWKNQVDIKYIGFKSENLSNQGSGYPVDGDSLAGAGTKIIADLVVTPKDGFAWTDQSLDEKTFLAAASGKVKHQVLANDFSIKYPKIIANNSINVALFPGYHLSETQAKTKQGESYVELYYLSTKDEESKDPTTLTGYAKINNWQPGVINPKLNKIYDEHEVDLSTILPSGNKYANFKLVYKDYFKSSDQAPYIWYDVAATSLPYDKPTFKNKIVKEGNDLVSYTYSIPYKLF